MAQGDREIVSMRLDGGQHHDDSTMKSIVRLSCSEEDVKVYIGRGEGDGVK